MLPKAHAMASRTRAVQMEKWVSSEDSLPSLETHAKLIPNEEIVPFIRVANSSR